MGSLGDGPSPERKRLWQEISAALQLGGRRETFILRQLLAGGKGRNEKTQPEAGGRVSP